MISPAILLSIGFISLLVSVPWMCYLDLRYRKVSPWYFALLCVFNIPVTGYLYYLGILPWTHLLTSIAICVFAFAIWKMYGAGAFSAADRNLIYCIALFFYWNPFSGAMDLNYAGFIAVMYQVKFLVYFVMVLCLMPLCVFALNLGRGMHLNYFPVKYGDVVLMEPQEPYTAWEMLTKVPRGIPMILPIAAAFFISAIWGV
jgi:hypothetical protein